VRRRRARGCDVGGTSIYVRANLQEVAAAPTLDRARECGVVPDHGTGAVFHGKEKVYGSIP
jgi:hypothetical protein